MSSNIEVCRGHEGEEYRDAQEQQDETRVYTEGAEKKHETDKYPV